MWAAQGCAGICFLTWLAIGKRMILLAFNKPITWARKSLTNDGLVKSVRVLTPSEGNDISNYIKQGSLST